MSIENLHRSNSYFKFLLVVIDVLSRYAFVVPLKNKSGIEVAKALDSIFKVRPCKFLQSDLGTDFYNQNVSKVLKSYNITLFSTYSNVKASCVERLIQTLRRRIHRVITHKKS